MAFNQFFYDSISFGLFHRYVPFAIYHDSPFANHASMCVLFCFHAHFGLRAHYINFLLIFPLFGHKLRFYHMPVDAVRFLQFLRCSLLPGDTILKHHDMIGTINCAHPVRDNENCLILDQLGYGLLDYQFIAHIK